MKKIRNFLQSMRFGMLLLCLILLCSLAGSLIPQGNTAAWYAEAYPGWHGLLLALGLHDVFNSWYFIALTALLCLNLTLCSILRVARVAKAAQADMERAAAREVETRLTPEGLARLRAHLEARRYKKTEREGATVYSRNHAGRYGSFLTHLAILLTVLLGAATIYLPEVTDQTCMPGQAVTMQDGTMIHVDDFHIENEAGELDYASTLRVTLADGREGEARRVSVNHPYSFGGYKIYQQTYGTAGAVRVRNTQTGGEDRFTLDSMCFLSLDGINGLWFEALYPGYIRDAEGNFTLITQTAGAYEDPVYQVLLSVDGAHTPVLAFPGETLAVAGVEYTFEDPVEYPGLRIKKTPRALNALLCAAFALMTLGLWLCFFQSPVSVTVNREGYAVTGPKPQGVALELELLLQEEKMGG